MPACDFKRLQTDRESLILVISYFMPPRVAPRSIQVSRLLSYLKKFGWKFSIVTAKTGIMAKMMGLHDPRFASFYENEFDQHLISTWEPLEKMALSMDSLLLDGRLGYQLRNNSLWVKRATEISNDIISRQKVDAVVTFAVPWADHLVGLNIKRRYGLPWIAHFSDPWVDWVGNGKTNDNHDEFSKFYEHQTVNLSDALIFTTEKTLELVMSKYDFRLCEKAFVVPHGCDSAFNNGKKSERIDKTKFRIVYTGEFYQLRQPTDFFNALKILKKSGYNRNSIEVFFVGRTRFETLYQAAKCGILDMVNFLGRQPYMKSIELASTADLLLHIDLSVSNSVFLPSKLMDYLMLKRPILGITPKEGSSGMILEKIGCEVVQPGNPERLAEKLSLIIEKWTQGNLKISNEYLETMNEFDITNAASTMNGIICQTLGCTSHGVCS